MNRLRKSLLLAVLVLALVVPSAMAAGHQTIVDIAVEDGRFDTLVAAVVAADLADALSEGEWTVFAPTDDAFAKLGLNESNIASAFSKAELTDILLYHALPGKVDSNTAVSLQGDITMANGQIAGLKVFEGDLYVNDDSKVIIPDIFGNNGIIHVVDTVILGPWPKDAAEEAAPAEAMPEEEMAAPAEAEAMPEEEMAAPAETDATAAAEAAPVSGNTIVDVAVADGRFDTLVAAVTAAGLADALSGGEWTVFAPTDDAFAKLPAGTVESLLQDPKGALTDILLYHALPGKVDSNTAVFLQGDITMANGQIAGLKVFEDNLYVNDDSKVIIPDIMTDNGVIHVVDTVILPPWPRDAE
jgi:transforming growth factor-beta-induced protein